MKHIPIAKSYFNSEEKQFVAETIDSGWIYQGKMVKEFENKVAGYVGAKYAVATSSGTAALHTALLISNIGSGDEVIIPSFSFIATANSVLYCGAQPVFVDIDLRTYNIDPDRIDNFIKKSCKLDMKKKVLSNKNTGGRVKAIIPVHQFGLPCDLDAISDIAARYGLSVVEDAACALGSSYKTKRIGGGNIACFSFHPRKILTTGEGGMIVTNNESYAKKAVLLRNHCSSVNKERYDALGYNYRITDLQAAVGIAQMSKLDQFINRRRVLAQRYDKNFNGMEGLNIPYIPPYAKTNFQSYLIRIGDHLGVSRDGVMKKLLKCGIHSRRGNTAIHMQPLYRKKSFRLPNTEKAAAQTIALPIFFEMTQEEQDFVIRKLLSFMKR